MDDETYVMTGKQWQEISAALNVACSVCMMHKAEFFQKMLSASKMMDDIVNAPTPVGAA